MMTTQAFRFSNSGYPNSRDYQNDLKSAARDVMTNYDADQDGKLSYTDFREFANDELGIDSRQDLHEVFDSFNGLDRGVEDPTLGREVSTMNQAELAAMLHFADQDTEASNGQPRNGQITGEQLVEVTQKGLNGNNKDLYPNGAPNDKAIQKSELYIKAGLDLFDNKEYGADMMERFNLNPNNTEYSQSASRNSYLHVEDPSKRLNKEAARTLGYSSPDQEMSGGETVAKGPMMDEMISKNDVPSKTIEEEPKRSPSVEGDDSVGEPKTLEELAESKTPSAAKTQKQADDEWKAYKKQQEADNQKTLDELEKLNEPIVIPEGNDSQSALDAKEQQLDVLLESVQLLSEQNQKMMEMIQQLQQNGNANSPQGAGTNVPNPQLQTDYKRTGWSTNGF
jgi:hypothetical protein